jgi:magnesium chelatase subunit I
VPRITDIYAAIPAITGKFELEYEGELKGADNVARELIRGAVSTVFDGHFPNGDFRQITDWFDMGGSLQVDDTLSSSEIASRTGAVQGLHEAARTIVPKRAPEGQMAAAIDFVLEGLYAQRKISRSLEGQFQASEQVKRAPRTVDQINEREVPASGGKKKYYN